MADGETSSLTLQLHAHISDIDADAWDACAGANNPFVSHAFLSALEDSGSATARTGWMPQHAALRDAAGNLVAAAPLYAKAHSYGEYVFDNGWANAFEQAGETYYPKLQAAVPFSPVPGPRLLINAASELKAAAMGSALVEVCKKLGLSSIHITFCQKSDYDALGENGWLQRLGTQFHWENQAYQNFDAFLSALTSNRRKVIKRERRDANNAGLTFKTLRGEDIKEHHWDAFYRFYQSTIDRKWGTAYLTRDFFSLLSQRLKNKVILMMAFHGDIPVAGALNLQGATTLYGRNWGCEGEWPFLHFELCYYRAIDYAIENRLGWVEAGAQGIHKIQRGYLPQPTYSVHWMAHEGLARAVSRFLDQERSEVETSMKTLSNYSPFRITEKDG